MLKAFYGQEAPVLMVFWGTGYFSNFIIVIKKKCSMANIEERDPFLSLCLYHLS